ncbi:Peptidyl-prolyl cis-trans isomerase [Chionoecetes opilio]|uniref:Peptidyl-prolyl cis-trans isomerase n=1 Tax=Chionoecetes opilio TaxID=41210 RepID=A0A8J4YAD0_CHIOP|nr:Peptidyl-prolyl cis-trans isomerase [Chionoecetes opilio]
MGGSKNKRKNKGQQKGAAISRPQQDKRDHTGTGVASATPAASVMECGICMERFDTGNRKPRNLQCGHGFCTLCCMSLEKHQTIICPKCRQETIVSHPDEYLPVNYPVLEIVASSGSNDAQANQNRKPASLKKESSPHGGRCLEAQADIYMHCAYCHMWLCKDCSRIDHQRPECLLTPFRDTLEEITRVGLAKATSSEDSLKKFSREGNAYSKKLRSFTTLLEIALDCAKMEQGHFQGILDQSQPLEQQLYDLRKEVPADLEKALCFLEGLEEVTSKTQQWAADKYAMLKDDQVSRVLKILLHTAVQMHMAVSPQASSGVMGLHRIKGIDITFPMEMYRGRLLVHAGRQRDPPIGSRVIKVEHIWSCINPSHALTFLDISRNGRELGKMFIRLMGCSKQSLCFLMMCTGEAGPSYHGTRFHRIWWPGLPGEHVWAGDHDHGDGGGGTVPAEILRKTKELPDEKTKMVITSGLVAGGYGKSNSTIFRMYTNPSTDGVEEVAFGRVEDGLCILKDAIKNNKNITDITISGCGVVVEP